jgi:hypothetical protein
MPISSQMASRAVGRVAPSHALVSCAVEARKHDAILDPLTARARLRQLWGSGFCWERRRAGAWRGPSANRQASCGGDPISRCKATCKTRPILT